MVVWFGMVWYGMVWWCGLVWPGSPTQVWAGIRLSQHSSAAQHSCPFIQATATDLWFEIPAVVILVVNCGCLAWVVTVGTVVLFYATKCPLWRDEIIRLFLEMKPLNDNF